MSDTANVNVDDVKTGERPAWRERNKDQYNAYHRQYRQKRKQADPKFAENLRAYQKQYRQLMKMKKQAAAAQPLISESTDLKKEE